MQIIGVDSRYKELPEAVNNTIVVAASFDIEATNDSNTKAAYMYVWQLYLNDCIYIGRKWAEFFELLDDMSYYYRTGKKRKLYIFIHNMAYEMAFMLPRLNDMELLEKVFAKEKHKPIEVVLKNGIVFRDTLAITNMSLAALAENYTKTKKLVGDLDYNVPRNSTTALSMKELHYCVNDVQILGEYADQLLKEYTLNKQKIPLTSTGIVRAYIKRVIGNERYYTGYIPSLYPQTVKEYNYTMRWLFRGGFTHAQTTICGDVHENVTSWDLTSAYPAVMLQKLYPLTPFVETLTPLEDMEKGKAVIFTAEFTNIRAKTLHTVESKHKCIDYEQAIFENGRLYSANKLVVMLTEIDYNIYNKFYSWDKCEILYAKSAYKKPLPEYLTKSIAYFYLRKKELKPIKDDSEALNREYMKVKGMLNSCYGMCVSRLNTTDIVYTDDGEWVEVPGKKYDEIVKKQFLSPYWGIYVTAYCRERILSAFEKIGKNALYGDTDSIKVLGNYSEIFNSFNSEIENVNKKICNRLQLDFEVYKDLGTFDNEGTYKRFKTYGAKRYIYTKYDKKKRRDITEAVIAGLPKSAIDEFVAEKGEAALYDFFENGMLFEQCGKNAHHYADETQAIINGELMSEKGSCYIFPVNFKMTIDSYFLALIQERKELKDYGEHQV